MKKLFEPVVVGGLALRNRLIRSATFEYAFDEASGTFASRLLPMYEKLADNGVGAIITGMVGVDENSRAAPVMVKAYGATFVPELTKLADRVRGLGAKLIVQINHCGLKARQIDGGGLSLGPCDSQNPQGKAVKGMSLDEIRATVEAFAATAARCREAGTDAVQIHAAHGYLLSQFLNPYFNRRDDVYGGDISGRARIVMEIYDAVRDATGPDYPVWIKINARDLTDPSLSPEDFLYVCGELDKRGLDAVEVSGGAMISPQSSPSPLIRNEDDEGHFAPDALRLADNISASVISVCGYRTPDVMERWLNKGVLAALSLCRPLISEPDLVKRWQQGDRRKARCISCSKCFNPGLACVPFSAKGTTDHA